MLLKPNYPWPINIPAIFRNSVDRWWLEFCKINIQSSRDCLNNIHVEPVVLDTLPPYPSHYIQWGFLNPNEKILTYTRSVLTVLIYKSLQYIFHIYEISERDIRELATKHGWLDMGRQIIRSCNTMHIAYDWFPIDINFESHKRQESMCWHLFVFRTNNSEEESLTILMNEEARTCPTIKLNIQNAVQRWKPEVTYQGSLCLPYHRNSPSILCFQGASSPYK